VNVKPEQEALSGAQGCRPVAANVSLVAFAAILGAETGIDGSIRPVLHVGAAPSAAIRAKQVGLDAAHATVQTRDARDLQRAFRPDRVATAVTRATGFALPLRSG
jgi:hypothetical protein